MEDNIFSKSIICDTDLDHKVLIVTYMNEDGGFYGEEVSNKHEPDKYYRITQGWENRDIHFQ